jgi:long-chain acyl-CoA synthetase
MLVQDFLIHSSTRGPQAEALVAGSRRVRYEELSNAAYALAVSLVEGGLKPGERVAVLTDVPFDFIVSYFGTLLAGGVFVGLNTQTSGRTLGHLLCDCGASIVLTNRKFIKYFEELSEGLPSVRTLALAGSGSLPGFTCCDFAELLRGNDKNMRILPRRSESDLAQIIYTSGTTGDPKGVMLTHRNLVSNTLSTVQYLGLTVQDRVMVVLPFFYSYGNSILLTHMAVGGTLVVNQSLLYPNIILEQMISEKVTGLPGVPSTFALLLHRSGIHDYTFSHLRYVTQAGGAMSPALARKLASVLTGASIYVMYGQTEAAPRLSFLDPADLYRKSGSIGKAIPGVILEVISPDGEIASPGEVGELVATGDNVMAGYWGQPEATANVLRDGRLWTGDLATTDEEGFLYLVGRKSEMLKSGAHRIAPKEIEEVLQEHDAVYEAAVIGIEDEILGEAIKACIVLKQGVLCLEKELLHHCRQILPAYKVPHIIEFRKELPKTESGKTKKSELKVTAQRLHGA